MDASLKRLGNGLCRPLSDPSFRLFDADRGDAGGAERCREGRQSALSRCLLHVRLAIGMKAIGLQRLVAQFVSMQNYYNLLYREEEREMMPFCAIRDRRHPLVANGPRLSRRLRGRRGAPRQSRGRTDPFSVSARPRLAPGRSDPQAGRRDGGEARDQAGDRGARLGALEALRDRADRRRLEAASPRRRGSGFVELKLDARTIARLEEPYRPKEVVGHG